MFLLVAIIALYLKVGTFSIPEMMGQSFPHEFQSWIFLAFFISFAIKVPMFPFHTWLPAAHVEAPTAGSVLLASVLLKMGTYGFLRFSLPMAPYATHYFTPLILWLSVVGHSLWRASPRWPRPTSRSSWLIRASRTWASPRLASSP